MQIFRRSDASPLAEWWRTVDKGLIAAALILLGAGLVLSLAAGPAALLRIVLNRATGVPGSADPSVTRVSPAIAALELARSSWAASIAFGSTLARLAAAASSVPCARLRSGPLERTLDIVTDWLAAADLAPASDR